MTQSAAENEHLRPRARSRPRNQADPGDGAVELLRAMSRSATAIAAAVDSGRVLDVLVEGATSVLGAERAFVVERTGVQAGAVPPLDLAGPWTDVLESGRSVRTTRGEIESDARWRPALDLSNGEMPRRTLLAVPFGGRPGRSGILGVIDRKVGEFGPIDEAILVQLAHVASKALQHARLLRAIRAARKRLGESAETVRLRAAELQAAIDAMADPVFVWDRDDAPAMTNPAADDLFRDAPVTSFVDLMSRFDPPLQPADEAGRRPLTLAHAPERRFRLRVRSVGPPNDGAASRACIAVLRDAPSEDKDRRRREVFLDVLSHELRTPITTIYAGTTMLAQADNVPPELRKELTADIRSEAERLFRMVEDLLVITRLDHDVLDLSREPVPLGRVAATAVRRERAHRPETAIELVGPTDQPAVAGDALRIEQVVRNLISNAVQDSRLGVPVRVSLVSGDGEVALRVVDGSTWLEAHGVRDLFELVDEREPSTVAQASGAGIGLFVCRRLVQRMGGRIWGRPLDGGGTEFGFALPYYRDAG